MPTPQHETFSGDSRENTAFLGHLINVLVITWLDLLHICSRSTITMHFGPAIEHKRIHVH